VRRKRERKRKGMHRHQRSRGGGGLELERQYAKAVALERKVETERVSEMNPWIDSSTSTMVILDFLMPEYSSSFCFRNCTRAVLAHLMLYTTGF